MAEKHIITSLQDDWLSANRAPVKCGEAPNQFDGKIVDGFLLLLANYHTESMSESLKIKEVTDKFLDAKEAGAETIHLTPPDMVALKSVITKQAKGVPAYWLAQLHKLFELAKEKDDGKPAKAPAKEETPTA